MSDADVQRDLGRIEGTLQGVETGLEKLGGRFDSFERANAEQHGEMMAKVGRALTWQAEQKGSSHRSEKDWSVLRNGVSGAIGGLIVLGTGWLMHLKP